MKSDFQVISIISVELKVEFGRKKNCCLPLLACCNAVVDEVAVVVVFGAEKFVTKASIWESLPKYGLEFFLPTVLPPPFWR